MTHTERTIKRIMKTNWVILGLIIATLIVNIVALHRAGQQPTTQEYDKEIQDSRKRQDSIRRAGDSLKQHVDTADIDSIIDLLSRLRTARSAGIQN